MIKKKITLQYCVQYSLYPYFFTLPSSRHLHAWLVVTRYVYGKVCYARNYSQP